MTDSQDVVNDAPDWKYFHMMPNMTDDDLDAYEYRLLGHYRRRGMCTEAIATTAETCHMSLSKVRSTRKALAQKGYITVKQIEGIGTRITIIDKWSENVQRYATPIKSDTPIKNGMGKSAGPLSKMEGEPLSDLIPKEQPIEEKHNTNTIPDGSNEPSLAELIAKLEAAGKKIAELESQLAARSEKSEEPPSSAPPPKVKQRKPRAPSPRDPLFNLVAKHVFGLDQVNGEGKKVGNFQKQLLEHIFGSPPYDPLKVEGLVTDLDGMWNNWSVSHPGLHKPCKLDSIGRGLKDYRDSLKVGTNGHNATAHAHKTNYGF